MQFTKFNKFIQFTQFFQFVQFIQSSPLILFSLIVSFSFSSKF